MNRYIFNFLHDLAGQSWLLDWVGIFLAEYLPYLMIIYALYLGFTVGTYQKRIYYFSCLVLTAILARGILTPLVRFFYPHERPFQVLHFEPLLRNHDLASSLPSGHAAFYFALAFVVFYFYKKPGSCLIVAASLVGLARIFVGQHWPLDILAGVFIALVSFFVISQLLKPRTHLNTAS